MLRILIIIALTLTALKWGGIITWSWAAIWGPSALVLGIIIVALVLLLIVIGLIVTAQARCEGKRK